MADITQTNLDATVSRDAGLDISSLLKTSKEEAPVEKSNLEKLKEMKEKGSLGLVVDNAELQQANSRRPLITNKSESDGMDEADTYLAEQDALINAAKKVNFDRVPTSPLEMAGLIDNLETASRNKEFMASDSTASVKVRTEEEQASDLDKSGEETPSIEINDDEEQPKEKTADELAAEEEKKKIVEILIDKTGLGGDVHFTEEEKEKMFTSTEIRLKEVEEVDLSTIKIRKKEKSFIESVNEFQISSSKVPVTFPASRFRAYMTGLSYGY